VEVFEPVESLTGSDDEADSQNMNSAIETAIGQCPAQYFWALKYFQTRPPGEVSVYD
jgi:KDO2-lipid IV(A) lauroyltransferase